MIESFKTEPMTKREKFVARQFLLIGLVIGLVLGSYVVYAIDYWTGW